MDIRQCESVTRSVCELVFQFRLMDEPNRTGSVDVSFPIGGDRGTGTALFTSIRRTSDSAFEIRTSTSSRLSDALILSTVRWKVILPDGRTVDLMDSSDVPITVAA